MDPTLAGIAEGQIGGSDSQTPISRRRWAVIDRRAPFPEQYLIIFIFFVVLGLDKAR
jgi:hypothetical protein